MKAVSLLRSPCAVWVIVNVTSWPHILAITAVADHQFRLNESRATREQARKQCLKSHVVIAEIGLLRLSPAVLGFVRDYVLVGHPLCGGRACSQVSSCGKGRE